jgi:hypothetical protein
MLKISRCGLAALFMAVTLTGATGHAAETENREQLAIVRATEPTVVTVEGDVEAEKQGRDRGGKVKRGAAAVPRVAGRLTGWLLNVNEDIPSERERAQALTARKP